MGRWEVEEMGGVGLCGWGDDSESTGGGEAGDWFGGGEERETVFVVGFKGRDVI